MEPINPSSSQIFAEGGFAASRGGLDYKERLSSLVSAPPFNPMQWDAPQL